MFKHSEAEQPFEIKSDHLSIDPTTLIEINVGDPSAMIADGPYFYSCPDDPLERAEEKSQKPKLSGKEAIAYRKGNRSKERNKYKVGQEKPVETVYSEEDKVRIERVNAKRLRVGSSGPVQVVDGAVPNTTIIGGGVRVFRFKLASEADVNVVPKRLYPPRPADWYVHLPVQQLHHRLTRMPEFFHHFGGVKIDGIELLGTSTEILRYVENVMHKMHGLGLSDLIFAPPNREDWNEEDVDAALRDFFAMADRYGITLHVRSLYRIEGISNHPLSQEKFRLVRNAYDYDPWEHFRPELQKSNVPSLDNSSSVPLSPFVSVKRYYQRACYPISGFEPSKAADLHAFDGKILLLDPEYVDWSEIQADLDFIGNTPPAIEDHVLYVSPPAAVDSMVGSVEAYDGDIATGQQQELNYELTGGSGTAIFRIDASTGDIFFGGKTKLAPGDRYTLKVTVSDSIDRDRTSEGVVTLLVQDSSSRAPAIGERTVVVKEDTNQNDAPVFYSGHIDKDKGALLVPHEGSLAETAYDPNGNALVFCKVSGPEWLVVEENGELSGTPTLSDFGRNMFSVEAKDTEGKTATASLEISVFDNPALWNDSIVDDFEFPDVFGNWVPSSNELADKGGGGHIGDQSLPLSAGSGLTAIVSAKPMDLGDAAHMKIDFRVRALSQESGESLRIDCSNDGGSSWKNVKRYDVGTDLVGGMWQARMLVLDNQIHGLTSDVKVCFRIEGSSNKGSVIFLDNICIARSKAIKTPSTLD